MLVNPRTIGSDLGLGDWDVLFESSGQPCTTQHDEIIALFMVLEYFGGDLK